MTPNRELKSVPACGLHIDDLVYIDAVSTGLKSAVERLKLTVEGKAIQPEVQAYQDIEIVPLNVTINAPPPAQYATGIQIRAKRFSHPKIYVRITASAPIHSKFCLDRGQFTGCRNAIATAIHGHTLEHTEGPPGLEPENPWSFCLFSEQPIRVIGVKVRQENPFNDVAMRAANAN